MKNILFLVIMTIFLFSCNEEGNEKSGTIDSFSLYIPFTKLDIEENLVNKIINTKIKYTDEEVIYYNNSHQILKEITILTDFKDVNLSKVIVNYKEATIWQPDSKSFFVNNGKIGDSLIKFKENINLIDYELNGIIQRFNLKLDMPVRFKNLNFNDIVNKKKDLILNWNSNTSKYAELSFTDINMDESGSWLIPNTGSIRLSSNILNDLKSGIYNFKIKRFDFIPFEIEEGKNILIQFESSQSIAIKLE